MKHHKPTDEVRELAALYALGALDSDELERVEAHLAEGCRVCEQEISTFKAVVSKLGSVHLKRPRPGARAKLLSQTIRKVKNPKSS